VILIVAGGREKRRRRRGKSREKNENKISGDGVHNLLRLLKSHPLRSMP